MVSDGERTAGVSIRGWRRFARAARGVVERVAASSTPPFPGRERLDFEPEPPPIFFFLFSTTRTLRRRSRTSRRRRRSTRGWREPPCTLRRKSSCRRRLREGGVGAECDFRPERPFGFSRRLEAPPPRLLPPWHETWFFRVGPVCVFSHKPITYPLHPDPAKRRSATSHFAVATPSSWHHRAC